MIMALEKTTECSERGKRGGKNGANTSMTRIIIDLSQCAAALDLSYAKCGQISSTQGSPFNSNSTQPGVQEGF